MTLILCRTSLRYSLMVTDRRVTAAGKLFDPDANKNIVFADKNAVIALGYTGLAHVGSIPTDQWLVQCMTGLSFPQGRGGAGAVPAIIMSQYEEWYWGERVRMLLEVLNSAPQYVLPRYRTAWTSQSFDLVMTGWEWNRGQARPFLGELSKAKGSNEFRFDQPERRWYYPRGNRFPVITTAAPAENLAIDELRRIDAELDERTRTDPSPVTAAESATQLLTSTMRGVSKRLDVVGPDVMSIVIPPPFGADPFIAIRYLAAQRGHGMLLSTGYQRQVPVCFTPWIVASGCIRAPSVITNVSVGSTCGPYTVRAEAPPVPSSPGAVSGQTRRGLPR